MNNAHLARALAACLLALAGCSSDPPAASPPESAPRKVARPVTSSVVGTEWLQDSWFPTRFTDEDIQGFDTISDWRTPYVKNNTARLPTALVAANIRSVVRTADSPDQLLWAYQAASHVVDVLNVVLERKCDSVINFMESPESDELEVFVKQHDWLGRRYMAEGQSVYVYLDADFWKRAGERFPGSAVADLVGFSSAMYGNASFQDHYPFYDIWCHDTATCSPIGEGQYVAVISEAKRVLRSPGIPESERQKVKQALTEIAKDVSGSTRYPNDACIDAPETPAQRDVEVQEEVAALVSDHADIFSSRQLRRLKYRRWKYMQVY